MTNMLFSYTLPYLIQTPGSTSTKAAQMTGAQSKIVDFLVWIINKLPYLFGAIAVMLITFVIARIVNNAVVNSLSKHNADDQVTLLVGKSAHTGVVIIGFTIALKVIGIDITPIVGLLGLGFGFAMQDIIKNFVSGALLLIQEPFRIGDVIQVNAFTGKVEAIEARSTSIKTFEGQRVIIPNADIFSGTVTNFSAHPERRMEIIVGVHYNTNLNYARDVMLQVVTSHTEVLAKPKPIVFFDAFSESAINISIKFWVDKDSNILGIRSELLNGIKIAFESVGINIPYPIRTLDIPSSKHQDQIDRAILEAKNEENIQVNYSNNSIVPEAIQTIQTENLNPEAAVIPATPVIHEHSEFVIERNSSGVNSATENPFKHTDLTA